MRNAMYYAITVLVWGSTWYAIRLQIGPVPVEYSIAYRFAGASLCFFLWARLAGQPLRLERGQITPVLAQGMFLFCLNFILIYYGTLHVPSGLVSVIFSMMVVINPLLAAFFLDKPLRLRVVAGGVTGLVGIGCIFAPELKLVEGSSAVMQGVIFCAVGTLCASIGNIISAKNQARELPFLTTTAYGMAFGGLLTVALALMLGKSPAIELNLRYLGSLSFLILFGSVIGFYCYLKLLGNIGPEKAAYTTVVIPVVALTISTFLENYHWTPLALTGVALVIGGNIISLGRKVSLAGLLPFRARPTA
jgi:drug/metabolite transporter (DMT)-like permease